MTAAATHVAGATVKSLNALRDQSGGYLFDQWGNPLLQQASLAGGAAAVVAGPVDNAAAVTAISAGSATVEGINL